MNRTFAFAHADCLFRRIVRFAPVMLAVAAFGGGERCRGEVTLPALISDNMVLQRGTRANVWGKADPGESVTVRLGPDSAQTMAGTDGNWGVKLNALPSGGPYDLTVSGKNTITVHNVAVGEVWVCAGESNMEYKVVAARDAQKEMADAAMPMVRVFVVKHDAQEEPQGDCEGAWVVCDPDSVKDFPAVAYFFARELNLEMRVPFGLIESAWGTSRVEAWTPRATLEKDPALHGVLDRYDQAVADYPEALTDYQGKVAAMGVALAARGASGGPVAEPVRPLEPGGAREPAALFNGMIAPLARYTIRGVLWYQGESDTGDPELYGKLFPAMIEGWRTVWNEGEFPFFYVQLSGFLGRHAQPEASNWAELREAQRQALNTPKTGMAVTVDTGVEHDMHPPDKQDVGHRLALIAESEVYGKEGVTTSGPVYAGMAVADGKAAISFTHTDGRLVGRNGAALKGFQIAGADGNFVWADAKIDGDRVIVQSKDVPAPAAVRYAWADFPDCDLFNKDGLPAGPFRTDGVGAEASPAATPGKRKHRAE